MLLMADVIKGNRDVVWSLEWPEQGSSMAEPLSHTCVWHWGGAASKVHAHSYIFRVGACPSPTLSLESCSWGKGWQLEKVG